MSYDRCHSQPLQGDLMAEEGSSPRPALSPRDRMVRSAAQLIRRQGVSATGMRDVVLDANAPRGSLQHYFPDGKDQLVSEALLFMGGVAGRRAQRALEVTGGRSPAALLAQIVSVWKDDLRTERFVGGCPLVAGAADVAATNSELRDVIATAFDDWQKPLSSALVETGIPKERSEALAILVISALEGAIVLSRIRRSLAPLDVLVTELSPVLEAAVSRERRRR